MKFSKLTLAITVALTAGVSSSAFAINLYVDTKTKQIYAEPGRNRVLMGEFEKVGDRPQQVQPDAGELAAVRQDLELKTNEIKALQEHAEEASKAPKVHVDKTGLHVETDDKKFKFRLGGRIQTDATMTSNDNLRKGTAFTGANDGTEIRRGRLEFLGTFFNDWNFKSQVDFADNGTAVKDMYVNYTGIKPLIITFGQQKQAFSRELYESSNDLMFMERSLMNVLNGPIVDRAIGLNIATMQKDYTAQIGVYGDTVTGNSTTSRRGEGWAVSSRATYAPINEKTKLVHLGIAGNYRTPNSSSQYLDKALRFEYETSHSSNLFLVDTSIANAKDITMLGLELSTMYGPFTLSGEYTDMWINRKNGGINGGNLNFQGWYADASWTITGESRKYKDGKFYNVSPNKAFSFSKDGGWGAWELAARVSGVNMNDSIYKGGAMNNATAALNWYVNDNIRFMADYTGVFGVKNSPYTTTSGGQPNGVNTFTLRGQLFF